MKMSDKDFDQLFNAKLGDMEMEPSASVWSNITDELDGKQKDKKAGLPFMKIAAGIVVLMAVGLFFIRPEHQKIQLTASTIKEPVEVSQSGTTTTNTAVSVQPEITDVQSSTVAEVVKPIVKHRESQRVERFEMAAAKSVDTAKVQPQYVAKVTEPVNQNTNNTRVAANTSTAALLPETTGSFATKPTIKEPNTNTTPVIAANSTTEKKATEPAKRKRIHSLGDLLNVVIAKVDKREDKLIEFTNTSDDDSFNVTGLNLGLLHAKKKK
jgi:hypothetical protein